MNRIAATDSTERHVLKTKLGAVTEELTRSGWSEFSQHLETCGAAPVRALVFMVGMKRGSLRPQCLNV